MTQAPPATSLSLAALFLNNAEQFVFALDLSVSLADCLRYSRSAKLNKFAFALDLFVSLHNANQK